MIQERRDGGKCVVTAGSGAQCMETEEACDRETLGSVRQARSHARFRYFIVRAVAS